VQQISALPAANTSRRVEPPPAQTGGPEAAPHLHGRIELVGLGTEPSEAKGDHFHAVPPLHQQVAARPPRRDRDRSDAARRDRDGRDHGGAAVGHGGPERFELGELLSVPGLCKRLPDAPRAEDVHGARRLLHATGALVRPIGTPTVPNHAAGDPIDSIRPTPCL